MPNKTKPSGVTPKHLWLETRIKELNRAINDYEKQGRGNENIVKIWKFELNECINWRFGACESQHDKTRLELLIKG